MRRRTQLIAGSIAAAVVLIAGSLTVAFRASQHVPQFYAQALAIDARQQTEASLELGNRVTTLYNDARRDGDWFAHFTAPQINAWLAVDLMEKHPDLVAENTHDPRINIASDQLSLAVRVDEGLFSVVYHFLADVFLQEPNVVAFRIRKARAGRLPLPMNTVLEEISTAADNLNVDLRWSQIDGDPLAIVTIAPQADENNNALWLEKLELREGEIYLGGRTVLRDDTTGRLPGQSRLAFQLRDHIKRQR